VNLSVISEPFSSKRVNINKGQRISIISFFSKLSSEEFSLSSGDSSGHSKDKPVDVFITRRLSFRSEISEHLVIKIQQVSKSGKSIDIKTRSFRSSFNFIRIEIDEFIRLNSSESSISIFSSIINTHSR